MLVLEAESAGSGQAATTWVRTWDQATWQELIGQLLAARTRSPAVVSASCSSWFASTTTTMPYA